MIEAIITALQLLIFPGALFLLGLAMFYEWVDRKVVARAQKRYGPLHVGPSGLLQPFADFLKLMRKEDLTPEQADKRIYATAPIIFSILPLVALFIVPIAGTTSLLAFEGDLLFVIFLFTLIMITVFLAGYSSMNRFGTIGSSRAALQMLGYEIPLGMAMIGPAMVAGSLSISGIVQWQTANNIWTILLQPIGFVVIVICMLAELEFVPFDIPHAKTEIVAGWKTEYSGRKLALIRLGKDLELVFGSALIAALYLGGPQQIWLFPPILSFLVKTILVVMLLSLLRAAFARFRIDQMVSGMWKYLVPIAIIQMILIQIGFGGL